MRTIAIICPTSKGFKRYVERMIAYYSPLSHDYRKAAGELIIANTRYIWIHSADQIRGTALHGVIEYGTYPEMPDLKEILEATRVCLIAGKHPTPSPIPKN